MVLLLTRILDKRLAEALCPPTRKDTNLFFENQSLPASFPRASFLIGAVTDVTFCRRVS